MKTDKTLEELAKEQIIRSYENGMDELNIGYINFCREQNKYPRVMCRYIDESDNILNPEFDIVKFVNTLTPDEILTVIDSQACQRYR